MADGVNVVVNARELQSALRRVSADGARETRRELAAISRAGRDRIRADWTRGPAKGGHSFRAVTSGTKGFIPYIRLNRNYRPYVGWLVFGGRRRRVYKSGIRFDRRDRRLDIGTRDGLWFYPEIRRIRPEATRRVLRVLNTAVRRAGLS